MIQIQMIHHHLKIIKKINQNQIQINQEKFKYDDSDEYKEKKT